MAEIKQILINTFDTISEDKRDLPNGQFRYLENLDIGNFNHSAMQVSNITTITNDQCILKLVRYGYDIYGIGWTNTTNKDVCLYKFNTTTNVYDVLTTSTVTGTMTNLNPLFAIMNGIIYFDGGNAKVCTYVLSTNTLNTSFATPTGTVSGGVSWQGSLYGWDNTDNDIRKIDETTPAWTSMILIPKTQSIRQIVPFGSYLAIVCAASAISMDGKSKMYLWDGVTTTTFADIVDIGYGLTAGGDVLDGIIYVVIGFANGRGFRIKAYSGGIFQTVYTYFGRTSLVSNINYSVPSSLVKSYTGFIYFIVSGARPGSSDPLVLEQAIFRYGKKNAGENNRLSVFKTLDGMPIYGESDFIIYESDIDTSVHSENRVYAVVIESSFKTRQVITMSDNYASQPGVVETSVLTGGDSSTTKHFKALAVQHAPLTAGQTIATYYRKDGETQWTLMGTSSEVGTIDYTINNIESSGASAPDFNEIAFRFEILGGAELTAFRFKYEDLEDIYG